MAKIRPFVLPSIFLLAAAAPAVLLWNGLLPDPIFYVRVDLGNLFFLGGLSVAIAWGAANAWLAAARQVSRGEARTIAADERRRFLGRLDHELKNPLTAILAGLANLAGSPDGQARQEALSSVEAQAQRLSRLASDLRKLAELETRPLERTQVDITMMLRETFDLVQNLPGASERRLKLTLPQAPWPLPKANGDRDLLFLALHNLIDNAIKFTRQGDTIEVRAFEDGPAVVLEVADTGSGIPQDELGHVWEELYRAKGARGIPGSGLGLALVRAIVLRHGGQATLRSRAGQGTVVTLRLPVN